MQIRPVIKRQKINVFIFTEFQYSTDLKLFYVSLFVQFIYYLKSVEM